MSQERDWVVLDADDTLWDTTTLYTAACESVTSMASTASGQDQAVILAWQSARDVELAHEMGYSRHRFPKCMAETAMHFMGPGPHVEEASAIGYKVFTSQAHLRSDTLDVVSGMAHGWNLALLTAGDREIQERRLADFSLLHLFKAVRIVEAKSAAVLADLASDLGMLPARCWVVRDSLRSDILPASRVGFQAILVEANNWAAYEAHGHDLPPGCHSVPTLTAAMKIIGPGRSRAES
jgi:putative hydrolase of the HAD superfamily